MSERSVSSEIQVLVLDDEALIAYDVGASVEDCDLTLMGIALDFDEAEAICAKGTPDIAMLDIDIQGEPVWPLARRLKDAGAKIIFLSANCRHEELKSDFADCPRLEKPVPPQIVCDTIRSVADKIAA